MVVGVVEVMDLRLKFLDAFAASRAGQLESARDRRRGGAIDEKEIQQRRDAPADENENRPKPFAAAGSASMSIQMRNAKTPATTRRCRISNGMFSKYDMSELNMTPIFNAKTQRRKVKGRMRAAGSA